MALSDYLADATDPTLPMIPPPSAQQIAPQPPISPTALPSATQMQAPLPPAPLTRVSYPKEAGGGGAAVTSGPALAQMPGAVAGRPAGWVPSTEQTTTKQALQYSPETLRTIGEGLGARRELTEAQADYEGKVGTQQAIQQRAGALFDEATAEKQRMLQDRQLSAAREYHSKVETLMKDAASDREDPMKWFHDQPTGSKLLTTLGLMVAGFGHGWSGRGSSPMDIINSQIRASVESQRAAHQQKREGIQDVRSKFGELKESFGDESKAMLASEMAQRQALIGNLQQTAADVTAPAANRLRAAQIQQALAADNEKTLRELDHDQATSIEQMGSRHYQQAALGGQAPVGVEVKLANGRTATVSVATAKELGLLPQGQLEQRKTVAETVKLEADAAKAAGAAKSPLGPGVDAAIKAGQDLPSDAFLHAPVSYFAELLQGTDASATELRRESINRTMMGVMHKAYGARTPEAQKELAGAYMIDKGDRPERISQKIENFRQFVAGQPAYEPAPGEETE
jgi:hypothetical protein